MTYYAVLFIAGLFGGFVSGLAGIGGGLIFVFILEEGLKVHGVPDAQIAAFITANSIFAIVFSAGSGSYEHVKKGEMSFKSVLATAVVSIPTAWCIQYFLMNRGVISFELFNWILLTLLFVLMIKQLFPGRLPEVGKKERANTPPWKFSLAGAAGGTVAALTGLGGGVAMVPILTGVLKLPIHKAKAISLGVIFLTAVTMTMYNLIDQPDYKSTSVQVGYIFLLDCVVLVVGVLMTAKFGVQAARRISPKGVTLIFTVLVALLITKKLWAIIVN